MVPKIPFISYCFLGGRMPRLLSLLLVLYVCVAVGCGGGEKSESQSATNDRGNDRAANTSEPTPPPVTQSRPAVPEKATVEYEGISVTPYFDKEGTVTTLAVGTGDEFEIFVFVEYPEPWEMAGVEFRVEVPDGIEVESQGIFTDRAIVFGSWDTDISMGFGCKPADRFWTVKLKCVVEDTFKGGIVALEEGIQGPFLGLVTCGDQNKKIDVDPTTATLTAK